LRIIYIAGAYSAPTLAEVTRHVDQTRKMALELAERRIPFLSTVLQTAHFELLLGRQDPEHWIAVSLEILRRCDAIFLVPGWQKSKGAKLERETALARGMPVFEDIEMLAEWATRPKG